MRRGATVSLGQARAELLPGGGIEHRDLHAEIHVGHDATLARGGRQVARDRRHRPLPVLGALGGGLGRQAVTRQPSRPRPLGCDDHAEGEADGKARRAVRHDWTRSETVGGCELTFKVDGGKVMVGDESGKWATVTIADVKQSNGVIHVVDAVLLP